MSGSTENRTPGASERPGRRELVLTWGRSQAMLPLVGRIARDIMHYQQRLTELQPEMTRLDRRRQTLAWPERSRRYQLQEEIRTAATQLQQVRTELDSLGLVLLNATTGLVGFPTIVNEQRAFFSWRPSEERVAYWSFVGDDQRHPVPASWTRPQRERSARGAARPKR